MKGAWAEATSLCWILTEMVALSQMVLRHGHFSSALSFKESCFREDSLNKRLKKKK